MKRIAILLSTIVGCGEEGTQGAGVRVWHCDGVTERKLLDVGLPPAFEGNVDFVRKSGRCQGYAAVLTTDFTSGALSRVDLSTFRVEPNLFTTHSDAVLRHIDNRLYVLNRYPMDSIQVYDTTGTGLVRVGEEFSVGDGTANPQDICCSNRELCYVTRLGNPAVLIVNPETGKELGAIDLSSLDTDGNPDASSCFLAGTTLAVALQRLDASFDPQAPGQIAFIYVATDPPSLASTLDTAAPNPFGRFHALSNSTARIAEVGSLGGVTDGFLEDIDVGNRASLGKVLSEEELGGDVVGFDTCATGETWAIGADAAGTTRLHSIDLPLGKGKGHARPAHFEAENYRLTSIAADPCAPGHIWVSDRNVPAE